jgi:hypothetical protein
VCVFFLKNFLGANFRKLLTKKKGGGRIQQRDFLDLKKNQFAISWPKKNLEVARTRQDSKKDIY